MSFDNSITLKNDNGTSLVIQFEQGASRDTFIELPMTDERIITEKKFRTILQQLKDYLANPIDDNLFLKPVINSVKNDGTEIVLNLDDFTSPVYMRLAGILIRIDNNYDIIPPCNYFQDIRVDMLNSFSGGNPLSHGLVDGTTYELGLRFLTDGRFSSETVISYTYRNPISSYPVINNINVGAIDLTTGRCNIEVTTTIPLNTTAQHISTDWIIERMNGEDYVKVWTSYNDTINKETIDIGDLVFSSLSTDTEYYLTCRRNYDADRSSYYSSRYKFKTPKLILDEITTFKKYPNYVAISNPELEIGSTYRVSNGVTSRLLQSNEITSVVWKIYEGNTSVASYNGTGVYNWILNENTLSKNTNYTVQVYYTTTLFGNSNIATFQLKTRDFDGEMDSLPNIASKYGDWCYFGEIDSTQLMVDGINYRGVYSSSVSYKKLDEVNYNGKLYICIANTPANDYTFSSYFKSIDSDVGSGLYKSGLPSAGQLLEYLGLEDNLINTDFNQPSANFINQDSGYLKLQLPNGNVAYLTKKPIFTSFTVNDLIRSNLLHPYQRTIRIGKHLYYPRLMIKEATTPYEPIMSDFSDRNFNDNYKPTNNILRYNEEQIIPMLLNGKLAYFNIPAIGIDNVNYTELLYHRDKIQLMKVETTSSYYDILTIPLDNVDKNTISMRIVLERINEEDYPMDNISDLIVGNNEKIDGAYDKYDDVAYLGYVTDKEFLNTESIYNRVGLNIGTPINNVGWYKFYYQGLIYFFSDGVNIKDINYNTLRTYNLTQIHALMTNNKGTLPTNKLGKVNHNNLLYNISLPSVVNYGRMFSNRIVDTSTYNIFTNTDSNIDLRIANRCMLSSCLYAIARGKTPLNMTNGYKGSWPLHDFGNLIDGVGGIESDKTFISRNELKDGNIITNNEVDLFTISKQLVNEPGRAILCLTIPARLK